MVKNVVIVGLLVVMTFAGVALAREIVVTSTADNGAGTLRLALQMARSGDLVTFDPEVFPPSAPATIHLRNCLPSIRQGRITVDASEVGVILDGQALPADDAWGVEISSNGNAIYGLQVVNVPGPGIVLVEGASGNTIGGDRTLGKGPIGHANLCSGNNGGICMWGEEPSRNTIIGNLVGTDVTGTKPFGNVDGIFLSEGACYNTIGPDNIIAYSHEHAIVIQGSNSFGNTITRNSIHDNGRGGIKLLEGGNSSLPSPVITDFNLTEGFVAGTTCPNCTVEVFSSHGTQGEIYEGQTSADVTGSFTFNKGIPFTGSNLMAMTTDIYGSTSEFSAVSAMGEGRELTVTSIESSGPGSLRKVLEQARSGDSITFDPETFLPDDPSAIRVTSVLPSLTQGNLTIDASNAGVIIDGSGIDEPNVWGLEVFSDRNIICGLQVVNFTGFAIQIVGGSQHNTIGGDRSIGIGPLGQGNLCSGNNGGILLCDEGTAYNTITGNLIGTDVTGTKPVGNIDGMFVSGNSSHNTIGPGNIIAYNHERAIVIQGLDSVGNTITENSIHNNGWGGIQLLEGANDELVAPVISSFDLALGEAAGTACADCTIELFSEETSWQDCIDPRRLSAEGRVIEEIAKASSTGEFLIHMQQPFSYPHLTATATDLLGNTSEFSLATSGASRTWGLQVNSELPKHGIQPLEEADASYNRIGTMLPLLDSEGVDGADGIIRRMDSLGYMWNEFYIDAPDWVEVGVYEGYSDSTVTPAQDALIDGLIERGWKALLTLVFWDQSANSRVMQEGNSYSRYETEEEIQAYLDHVRSVVRHFRGQVEYYQILGEPNACPGTQQHVEVDNYINLVRRTVPVIRQEDPEARISVGGICFGAESQEGNTEEWIGYLFEILESDVIPLVDAVSWHPFYGASPGDPISRDYYYAYPGLVGQIKESASAHGFTGEYIAAQMTWFTPLTLHIGTPPGGAPPPGVCGVDQAVKYYARGVVLTLGMDVSASANGVDTVTPINIVVRNLCTIMAGHEAIDMPVEVAIDYEPSAYCTFRYANGDRMLAVWTDGIAQDEDPGVLATITFPGLTAGTITGIDVLHGFEQELVFEIDGDDTIIRDLLVKDYPILIRLSDVTMVPNYEETVGDGFHRLGDVSELPSSTGSGSDRDGDGVPDDKDYCPDWPGSTEANGC